MQVFLEFEMEPQLTENKLRYYFLREVQKFHAHVEIPRCFGQGIDVMYANMLTKQRQ